MKEYAKPQIITLDNLCLEPVLAANGSGEEPDIDSKVKCTYGRREFNPGADKCQTCNGVNYNIPGLYCKEGMPTK